MAEALRFEPFDRKRHDRSRFACGVPALDEYLRTSLGQHGRKDLTRGYVAVDPADVVVGYFTLAAGRLSVNVLGDRGRLPARMPLPTTLLARLAVDMSWQGRGIGAALLAYALRVAVGGAESIASAVIEVDAKDDTARSFYARFGFRSLTDDHLHMYLPMETARRAIGRA
ncbi:MAG: GNAT family N-acetyltransferase [Planctomycetota bacterium]|nr:GNAT family N-acetyltransferase [Planctomycetota bacterium]MBM4056965.1 GNAT family N-acetyltransferase [Planctomycetota bacterium]